MLTRYRLGVAAGLLAAGILGSLSSHAAPGEDPVLLEKKVTVQMQPLGSAPRSGYINPPGQIPDWQNARIKRYVAKAFSGDTTGILTDKDVINTVNSDGFKTTCTQSIGSVSGAATTAAGGVAKPTDQIVVVRGDLVNICN